MSKTIAQNIIRKVYENKFDKGGTPYINHLEYVSENSVNYFKSKNSVEIFKVKIIGLLHDLVEDYPSWTFEHIMSIFNDMEIVEALKLLTKSKFESYDDYIYKIHKNKYALAVKLADLEHNMDVKRLQKLGDFEVERLKKYYKAYGYLLNIFKKQQLETIPNVTQIIKQSTKTTPFNINKTQILD